MAFSEISGYHGVYANLYTPAIIIGGIFALIATVLSLWLILQHLRSYNNPAVISLSTPKFSLICDILRNCYEAFALYSFGSYLVACLGGEGEVIELLENEERKNLHEKLIEKKERRVGHEFFCNPSVLGEDLYTIVKFGLVQYMILKTLCAFLSLILEIFGFYGVGEFKWYYGYPYITVVINFSQMWALYCLVQFYNVTHHRLQRIKPLAKFISFKAIVFATWWQGVGIDLICYFGVLPKEEKIQNGIQDFLICVEMAIAAIAHIFVFSPEPYRYLPVSEDGNVTTSVDSKAKRKLEEDDGEEKPAIVEETETHVEAPGTSITESVHDVFIGGGETVVKDVVLTISQAMEPVEKGVNKIQETFHHITLGSEKDEEEPNLEIKEHVKENIKDGVPEVITEEREVKKL
ncbi:Organic solute transporter subunit alpha/Transmembrane protein 184 [Dioscorea alata]|uniref:Organic solute transporter subunit alpha/Transmembrane protein 184 n=1 Tax=Dioscorea alata TaxID=55571 RepID=A0ACB7U8A1_DIOAL|nr:Organic solute transporter subunit alpha/Transmembrane protein 184 [Dioscorea alata]